MDIKFKILVKVATSLMGKVIESGVPLNRCVWEVDPRMYRVMDDEARKHDSRPDPEGRSTPYFMGIPLRIDNQRDGILLKRVNLEMQQ